MLSAMRGVSSLLCRRSQSGVPVSMLRSSQILARYSTSIRQSSVLESSSRGSTFSSHVVRNWTGTADRKRPRLSGETHTVRCGSSTSATYRWRNNVPPMASARSFGDLSQNFEYHAAKNEQGLLERRIVMLRDRLDRAVLVDEKAVAASDTVGVGTRVEIEDEQGERMQVEISSVGGVSPDSPVGRALLGRKVGDEVEVEAPKGSWRARIVSIGL